MAKASSSGGGALSDLETWILKLQEWFNEIDSQLYEGFKKDICDCVEAAKELLKEWRMVKRWTLHGEGKRRKRRR